MQYFHQYKKLGSTLLILAGVALLQSCSFIEFVTSQSLNGFTKNNGMGKAFDTMAMKQIEEYKRTGKFSSALNLNVNCYQTYSKFSPANDVITNFAIRGECPWSEWDVDSVTTYMSRVSVGAKTAEGNLRITEVRCIEDSSVYRDGFKDESFAPRLVREKFPECPRGSQGQTILPLYRDYSVPRQTMALPNEASIIKELDRISSRQVEEFIKTGQYSSTLSFNSECGIYSSTISQSGNTVINWIIPARECYSQPLEDPIYGTFISVVFADEDRQKRTVDLSRIVCAGMDSAEDITRNPPNLGKGIPVCGGAEPRDDEPSDAIERKNRLRQPVIKQQYPSIPMR
jgi:hypothetical protein